VAQLMGLFGGGAGHLRQYWMLLFDHAMTTSTILSPSLDRDEVCFQKATISHATLGQPPENQLRSAKFVSASA